MANAKFTDLDAITSPVSTDIIPIISSPGSSPVAKKLTLANLLTALMNFGNVGIGTASPAGKLDVTGTNGKVVIESTGNNLDFTRAGNNYITATDAAGSLYLGANSIVDALVVNNAGNVGIGTASPTNGLLQVGATSHANTGACWGTGNCAGYCTGVLGTCTACTCITS